MSIHAPPNASGIATTAATLARRTRKGMTFGAESTFSSAGIVTGGSVTGAAITGASDVISSVAKGIRAWPNEPNILTNSASGRKRTKPSSLV